MTELLEEAIARVKALPERDQDAIAALILAELNEEAEPSELLVKLVDAAMAEARSEQNRRDRTAQSEREDLEELRESARLYAQVYESDRELQELTEAALRGWPD